MYGGLVSLLLLALLLGVDGFNSEYVAGVSVYSMVLPSIFSLCGSVSVLTTYIIFPPLRKLRYVELLSYTSINDILFCIGTLMGSVKTGSAACFYQGLTGNFCIVSSAFWTTVITYQLYLAVHGGRVLRRLMWYRIISVVIPVFLAVLPFTTNSYANVSGSYCFIDRSGGNRLRQKLWMVASFYFWIFLAVTLQIGLLVKIAHKLYLLGGDGNNSVKRIWSSFRKLVWYPVIFSVCWCFDAVADLSGIEQSDKDGGNGDNVISDGVVSEDFVIVGVALSMLQGFFFSLAFFANNTIVRECWLELLWNLRIEFLLCLGYDEDELYGEGPAAEQERDSEKQKQMDDVPDDRMPAQTRDSSRYSAGGLGLKLSTSGVRPSAGSIRASTGRERPSVFEMRATSAKVEQEPDFILPKGTRGLRSSEQGIDDRESGLAPPQGGDGGGDDIIPGPGHNKNAPTRGSSPIDVMEGGAAGSGSVRGSGGDSVDNPVWRERDRDADM